MWQNQKLANKGHDELADVAEKCFIQIKTILETNVQIVTCLTIDYSEVKCTDPIITNTALILDGES